MKLSRKIINPKMLDEYKRNGELFLEIIKQENENKNKSIDDLIKENFRRPVLELVGHTAIGKNASERDMLTAVGSRGGGYFQVSSKSYEILSSFFKTRKGVCSLCGKETDVFPNKAFIFPFERKIDSITPPDRRLYFCKECGFTLYCGMAYLYAKGYGERSIKFFFDSYNRKNLWKINDLFKNSDLRDPSRYNKIKNFKFFTYHPYETLFVIIFEFVNKLKEKNLMNELKSIDDVKLLLVVGSGQIQNTYIIKGSKLNNFVKFFSEMIDNSKEKYSNIKNKEILRVDSKHLIFNEFLSRLTVGQNTEEKSRLRDLFVKNLLDGKIDFITLNKIIMERVKKEKYPFPFYYRDFLNLYMKIFKMETEQQMFERIHGLGYTIGNKIKGTNLDGYVWEIFRARGIEEFYNVLVELQAKLEMNMDLRPINEHEKEWRKAKAILLNGILNALY